MTEYRVLSVDDSRFWSLADDVIEARSAADAIRKYAGATPGTFVAVPARSWQPRTVKVETQTRLTLEEVK